MISFYKLLLNILIIIIMVNCSPYSLPPDKSYYKEENAFNFYKKSIDYFLGGEYQLALQTIQKAIDMNENIAQFHKFKGDIYFRIKEDDKALVSYQNAIHHRSNFTEVYIKMGQIYKKNINYDDAIKVYRKVLVSDQTQINAYLELAYCYLELSRFEMALNNLENYEKIVLETKTEPAKDYYFLLGKVYFKFNRYKDAIVELEKVRKPFSQRVYYLLGRCHYGLHEYDLGLEYFNKLLSFDSEVGEYYLYRGIYFYNKNDFEDAVRQFRRALELDNSQKKAHYYLGKIYESYGKHEEAQKEFQQYNEN